MPEEVITPLRFALVVTVAAVPLMLMPCVFVHVLTSARRVVEATTIFAEPLKEIPLMVRVFCRMVAVPALPVMLIETAEEVAMEAKVFAPVAYRRPEAAEIFEEVAIPPKEMTGVVPPEEIIGQVPVTAVTPALAVDVAMKARPLVTFDHPKTCPPTPMP